MDRGDLQQLSKEQLIELVLRLQRPDKNSRTSSNPPSTDIQPLRPHIVRLLTAPSTCDLARALQAKIARARDQLLTFCDFPGEVEVTNNGSERKLRPCVIQIPSTSSSLQPGTTFHRQFFSFDVCPMPGFMVLEGSREQ